MIKYGVSSRGLSKDGKLGAEWTHNLIQAAKTAVTGSPPRAWCTLLYSVATGASVAAVAKDRFYTDTISYVLCI